MSKKSAHTIDDWLKAAFRALSRGGLAAVKAEAIARDLNISKGSFYWHFRDVPALKAQMLEHWRQRATDEIIETVDASGGNAEIRLRLLVDIATSELSTAYGGASVDGAMREWARYDANAASILKAVDDRRVDYVARLFLEVRLPREEAQRRARILYGALIGLEVLATDGEGNLRQEMHSLLEALLR